MPLAGSPPDERPLWRESLEDIVDLRRMAALRIRYETSAAEDTAPGGLLWEPEFCDAVRHSILRRVRHLLPAHAQLPDVVFDELSEQGRPPHYGQSIIELAFSDAESLELVYQGLKEIHVERPPSSNFEIFRLSARTNSLPGSIMRFDCQRLPLKSVNVDRLFKTLEEMASSVGKLLGIGKLVTETPEFGQVELGSLRGYIQLHRHIMIRPWKEVLARLSTHVEFEGVPYTLVYPGCASQKKTTIFVRADTPTPDPEENEQDEEEPAASNSAGKRRATDNDVNGSEAESSSAAKRRRNGND